MKHAHFILGLTMLCVAGTVTAYIVMQPPQDGNGARTSPPHDALRGGAANHEAVPAKRAPRVDYLIGGVEAPGQDPLLVERAALVEASAHQRLAEMTATHGLTRKQQARIFPLLARSSPHYDEALEITGRRGNNLVVPITRREADREIYELLDAEQQADLDLAEAEKNLWWSSVIARLERDLSDSTQSEQSSSPPAAASAPPSNSPPPGRRGGNPFNRSENQRQ